MPRPFRPFDFPTRSADWADVPAACRWWPARLAILAGVVALGVLEYAEGLTL